ncbi:hypothetical protein DFAR_3800036 [Desulfarculales bacterium]
MFPSADLLDSLRVQRSFRSFQNQDVKTEKLNQVIEADRFAPTGQNRQPLGYVVLTRKRGRPQARELILAALLAEADRLEAAQEQERMGGPGHGPRRPGLAELSPGPAPAQPPGRLGP